MVGFCDLGGLFQPRCLPDSVPKPQQWGSSSPFPFGSHFPHTNGVSGRAGKSWQPPRFSALLCFTGHNHKVSASTLCKKLSPVRGGDNQQEICARKKHSSLPEPAQGCKAKKGEYKGGTRRGLEQPRFVPRLKATQQTWTWMSLLFLFPPSHDEGVAGAGVSATGRGLGLGLGCGAATPGAPGSACPGLPSWEVPGSFLLPHPGGVVKPTAAIPLLVIAPVPPQPSPHPSPSPDGQTLTPPTNLPVRRGGKKYPHKPFFSLLFLPRLSFSSIECRAGTEPFWQQPAFTC